MIKQMDWINSEDKLPDPSLSVLIYQPKNEDYEEFLFVGHLLIDADYAISWVCDTNEEFDCIFTTNTSWCYIDKPEK